MAHRNRQQRTSRLPRPEPHQGPLPLPLACPPGDDYPIELFSLLEPAEVMRKQGYVVAPLGRQDLNMKARCKDCNQPISSLAGNLGSVLAERRRNPVPPPPKKSWDPLPTLLIPTGNGKYEKKQCVAACRFHPGTVDPITRYYSCCNSHVTEAKPCFNSNTHEIRYYAPGELARLYQFYPTPSSSDTEGLLLRAAVAIDCEMGTAMTGDSELIRLTAIDYLTGEVLINNIVDPDQYMMHLNTRYSGVTFPQLNEAKRKRTCLIGKAGAREALWRFVGPHTALVGHGVNNDLRALKWIHPTVVDSFLIEHKILQAKKAAIAAAEEAEAAAAAAAVAAAAAAATTALVEEPEHLLQKETSSPQTEVGPKKKKPKGSGDLSLKTLMKKYLDRDIQTQGNKGHDSFEDALAARDLVHWMVMRRLREKGLADANESGTLIDEGPQELI